VFEYFPGNGRWSAGFLLALTAGGQLGQIDRALSPLRDRDADPAEWTAAWDRAGDTQVDAADRDLARGRRVAASERLFHAATYYLTGERQTELGAAKTASYAAALLAFERAVDLMPRPLERISVPSPDGDLPGYFIPAQGVAGPAPVVIFYNGFDVTKELLWGIIRTTFAVRGIACLIIDGPGTGEPLRLRGVASRYDYEVPTSAIVDHLERRDDVDPTRIGLLGISLGGYYAPRGAAFEPRIAAVAAWGAIWDYGATWRKRWATQSADTPTPYFQLPWVMGVDTMEEALDRVEPFTLATALPHLRQPFLIVHAAQDGMPVADAERAFTAAGSTDKELVVFDGVDGGAAHVNVDDADPARQLIADWFAQKLGAA
jgi:alpha-beta hydrolase superfamily lysophospholipase